MSAAADDPDPELPPADIPGYAPRLCTHGPAHYARRDPEVTERIAWVCIECGLRWNTGGSE